MSHKADEKDVQPGTRRLKVPKRMMTCTVDPRLVAKMDALAVATENSRSQLVEKAVRKFLESKRNIALLAEA
jgi:predicted transcriptional regulator